jgi:hypothetical protein
MSAPTTLFQFNNVLEFAAYHEANPAAPSALVLVVSENNPSFRDPKETLNVSAGLNSPAGLVIFDSKLAVTSVV